MFSVILNIITLSIVGILFYAFYTMYKHREEPDLTASEVFQNFEKEPSTYSHRIFSEGSGPIGNFIGYTWKDDKLLETYGV
jgi:hypothetical protein